LLSALESIVPLGRISICGITLITGRGTINSGEYESAQIIAWSGGGCSPTDTAYPAPEDVLSGFVPFVKHALVKPAAERFP
jgi:hypothetical protein